MLNKDITIIINTFNSDEKIFSCLDTIEGTFKILVIENSNNSNFKKRIENEYSNVTCELTKDNLGYAKGNNLGLSKVTTKFALVLNPDTLVQKDALQNFLKTATNKPDFTIIGPAIQEKVDQNKYTNVSDLIEVKNVKGFAMFLNISKFNDIGFFDENFFLYLEEIDLCRRVIKKGKKIFIDSDIKILHEGAKSVDTTISFEVELTRNWHWMWSKFYFNKKHYGYLFALLLVSKKFFSAIIKIILYSLVFNQYKKKIYVQRFSGLFNSIIGNKSWYRPKIENN